MAANRNDPCPCGSGLKHKHCCMGETVWYKRPRWTGALMVLVLVAGLVLMGWAFFGENSGPPYDRPEGPAPPGKVWSPEHGHWHDAY